MQNPYNNFLKRQKQTSTNNFKEKVKNSLSGKTVNNTTMPNTSQIQSNIQQKARTVNPINAVTPVSPDVNKIGTGALSGVSTPVKTTNNVNARTTTSNALQTPLNASEGTSVITTPVETNNVTTPQTEVTPVVANTGMMSLSDINNAISPKARTIDTTTNAGANARTANTTTNYKDLLEQNKNDQLAQADKNWQVQEDAFNQQIDSLKDQYQQSVNDANNAYQDSVNTLNEQRYNQMEELNVSGTNRGIQYSPQQLGLENVANINHNKNLAETSKTRNELLNKLQIEMNNSLAQLNMTIATSRNEYNKNKLDITSDYYNTLVGWGREDEKTQSDRDWEQQLLEEKRAWEEAQALKDKEWEKQMQELQNKFEQTMQNSQNQFDKDQQTSQNNWQSGENALDREHDKTMAKSRGYSTYSGGGSSSYSRSYNPYTYDYSGYNSYDSGEVSAAALEDEIVQQAVDNKFKQLSTHAYNAFDTGGVYDLMERADLYSNSVAPMYDNYYGLNDTVDERLDNTRETALNHLVNKSIARSTNGAYNIGDTVYQHTSPLRQSYIDKVNSTKERTKAKVYNKHSKDTVKKFKTNRSANAEKIHEDIMKSAKKNSSSKTSSETKKSVSVSSSRTNTNRGKTSSNIEKKITKSLNKSTKNTKKATTNAKKNVKKNTNTKTSSKKTQTAISKSKKNSKKAGNNFIKNLKKNLKKIFK